MVTASSVHEIQEHGTLPTLITRRMHPQHQITHGWSVVRLTTTDDLEEVDSMAVVIAMEQGLFGRKRGIFVPPS